CCIHYYLFLQGWDISAIIFGGLVAALFSHVWEGGISHRSKMIILFISYRSPRQVACFSSALPCLIIVYSLLLDAYLRCHRSISCCWVSHRCFASLARPPLPMPSITSFRWRMCTRKSVNSHSRALSTATF